MTNTYNKICECGTEFLSNNKFCSKTCATHYTNKRRGPRTSETKEKIARGICKFYNTEYIENKDIKEIPLLSASRSKRPFTRIQYCSNCGVCFNASERKKTSLCSDECYIHTKIHKNALSKKKLIYKEVSFDSSWEITIAKLLDSLSIKWVRPKQSIKWVDLSGKERKYFPDFYLEEYDIFLDPKNPIVISKSLDKIKYLEKNYKNILIGSLHEIQTFILEMQRNYDIP
jgi:hypothetical protein